MAKTPSSVTPSSVMIVGYGTMGRGVALSFARTGLRTVVISRDPDRISDLPEGAEARADLPEEAPDLVIENIPEDLALKRELFLRLEKAYGGRPVLATNTSGLPIEEIAAPLSARDRFLAVHYMQPAEAFPLVEICCLEETAPKTLETALAALRLAGKDAIVLRKPVVGFLINRLQHAILHEAYYMIEEGIVSAEDVDRFARQLFGPRMCVTGLVEQKDLGGIDVNATAQRTIVPSLHHNGVPSPMVQEMFRRGDLGAKSGRGFYDWSGRDVDAYRRSSAEKLGRLMALLDEF